MNRRYFLNSTVAAGVAAALPGRHALATLYQSLTAVTADVQAVSGAGSEVVLEQAAVQELADSLRGSVLLPGNEGYEKARRVLNASIDKHPALVVQPTGVADIRNAVSFADERDLLLAVKCGGHSYAGKSTCEGGLQIDLSGFRSTRVDPASRTAYIAGGSLLAGLDHEAMAMGLVTTAGTVSHTGVGGLTLGAGFGRLARRFGLTIDNLKGVDIVTADGKFLHANAEENADLYWGVRGGGGNFGIVTSFEFGLHPMQRQVIGGEIVFPLARARDIMRFYSEYSLAAPDDLYCDLILNSAMGGGDGVIMLHACYSGPQANAEKVLAPIRKLGTPIADTIKAIDYVAIQKSWDNSDPRNEGEYLKSGFINDFPGELVDSLIDGFDSDPGRKTTVFFQHSGGAIGRVAADATAFAHRKSQHNMFAVVAWPLAEDRTPHVRYIRDYWKSLARHTDGFYTNESSDETASKVHGNYQGNFARLLALKNRYDPGNLFRLNANIVPTARG
jgi:FAD/FMN-containing dehydrogenase